MTRDHRDVMISSTTRDLPDYRTEARDAIWRRNLFPLMMEEAVELADRYEERVTLRVNLSRLGQIYEALQDWQSAREVIERRIALSSGPDDEPYLEEERARLARILAALNGVK